jgi:RNA polymerase sigma-70 factor, ECF subfamily
MLTYSSSPTGDAEAIRRGNLTVFEAVFRKWYEPLCRYAFNLCYDRQEAEDLVQQTFVKIWENHKKIDVRMNLKSYLYRSVYNQFIDRDRHRKVHLTYTMQPASGQPVMNPQEKMEAGELGRQLNKAMQKLPGQCAVIFKMSRLEMLKYKEIAEILGLSVKTVENQMGKALRILRTELADYLPLLFILLTPFI